MSEEGTSADLHVAAPEDEYRRVAEGKTGPTVGEQLVALRTAALDDLGAQHASYLRAQADAVRAKERQIRAAAVALDAGVELDVVAAVVGVNDGTIRKWTKSLEGGA